MAGKTKGPVTRRAVPGIKRKPRGKPFAKGNKVGPRFPKGVSGNPSGRPPMPPEHEAAMDLLEPLSYQALSEVLADPFHKDRAHVAEYVVNRRHGKPKERKELSGPGGKAIAVRSLDAMTTDEMRRELAALEATTGDGETEEDEAAGAPGDER